MKKPAIFLPAFLLMEILLFCTFHDAAAQANRGMAVPPEKLPKSLSEISPRDYFIPSSEKKVGVVHALEGTVVVIHGTAKEGYFAAAGDPVYEKDSLTTLAESKCRVRFVDEDIVTMAPETEFSVDSFEDQRAEGRKSSFFRMVKGKAMFYALRLFRYKDTRFTLATPTNTIGVRGTKFGAHVYFLENPKAASRPILVADAQTGIAPYLAQAGSGQSFTDCFSEDGVVDVDGRAVPPGQMFSGRTGMVVPTPPDVIQSFRQATEITTGGTTGQPPGPGGTDGGAPPPPPGAVTGGLAPLTADLQADITSIVQVQTAQQTEQATPQAIKSLPGPLYGYFSVLLIKSASSAGPFTVYDAFLSSYDSGNWYSPSQTDPSLNATAYAVVNTGGAPGDYLQVSGSPAPDTGTARLEGLTDSADKIDNSWTKTYLGEKSYTQWGYWEANQPAAFTHLNGNYYRLVLDRIWFLEGNHVTTAAEMPSGNYAYSGGAYGTYQGPGGYANLSGEFNCQVNLGSGTVQNFNLDVGDGNAAHKVIINQSSSVNINRNANGNYFYFNGASGTASIGGNSSTFRVNGSMYGPQAKEIGGNWGAVNTGTGEGAQGVFAGSQQP